MSERRGLGYRARAGSGSAFVGAFQRTYLSLRRDHFSSFSSFSNGRMVVANAK